MNRRNGAARNNSYTSSRKHFQKMIYAIEACAGAQKTKQLAYVFFCHDDVILAALTSFASLVSPQKRKFMRSSIVLLAALLVVVLVLVAPADAYRKRKGAGYKTPFWTKSPEEDLKVDTVVCYFENFLFMIGALIVFCHAVSSEGVRPQGSPWRFGEGSLHGMSCLFFACYLLLFGRSILILFPLRVL